jgi:hypothetical protein
MPLAERFEAAIVQRLRKAPFQRDRMRRRELIAMPGGATMWPLIAIAQQLAGTPRVVQLSPVDIPSQADQTRRLLSELDLRINLRVAKALGIELSPTILARADEVIE